jgi:acyl-CoA synthetase (AMP-forming)/AMP-acid ligase II
MRLSDNHPLWDATISRGMLARRFVADSAGCLTLTSLAEAPAATPEMFRGKSVLISCQRQLPAVVALLTLDGTARRIVLAPPDLSPAHLPEIAAEAEVDTIVTDGTGPAPRAMAGVPAFSPQVFAPQARAPHSRAAGPNRTNATEWLLFTSGTTGRPKLVVHTLASLTGPLDDGLRVVSDAVWSTFYDIRRYGGLQILLRALLGGGSMVLSSANEPVTDFLSRAGRAGVTHMSGTPSHWRRALMSASTGLISPGYVRLSGEVADQAILNQLAAAFPRAEIAHAFASTEAGVAFDVRDGLAGFPASMIGQPGAKAEMRIEDGSLRIRSSRTAARYLGDHGNLAGADGFVDTSDMVELRGDRYYFAGRREGVINVGGQKVHPEEIEAVINQHPAVQMVRVRGRRSAITGAIVVADVVTDADRQHSFETIRHEILARCRAALAPYKVPAMVYEAAALEISASGKLMRHDA